VTQIDPSSLIEEGVIGVLLDIDNTLVPRDTHVLSEEVVAWIAALKDVGLKVCLLSNNWHRTVFSYAERLDLPLVYKAMKPLPFSYLRALGKLGLRREGVDSGTVDTGTDLLSGVDTGTDLLSMIGESDH
jgi:HAD superfamily phosphatase (TIGR01668 family)